MLNVLTRIASSNEYTQHTIVLQKNEETSVVSYTTDIHILFPFSTNLVLWFQWLELPLSRSNFYGPKDVRANEVRLYSLMGIF